MSAIPTQNPFPRRYSSPRKAPRSRVRWLVDRPEGATTEGEDVPARFGKKEGKGGLGKEKGKEALPQVGLGPHSLPKG